jgi:hypothetical protein
MGYRHIVKSIHGSRVCKGSFHSADCHGHDELRLSCLSRCNFNSPRKAVQQVQRVQFGYYEWYPIVSPVRLKSQSPCLHVKKRSSHTHPHNPPTRSIIASTQPAP